MMKRVFKISLIVTVVSLLITLVLLPFGVRSMLDTANKWAEYTTYEVEYEQPAEGITQVNVKFTGREWMSCGVEQQSSGENITLSTSGLQLYDITTTSETDGTVLNLTVDFQVKPEFELAISDMVVQFAKRNMGVGCVVEGFAQEALERGEVFELEFYKPMPKRQICVVTAEKAVISLAGRSLLEMVMGGEKGI